MTYDPTHDSGALPGEARHVTAFFDSQSDADKARTDLIAAGLSPDTISIAGGGAAELDQPHDEGFWHALKEFFVPDEDRYAYAEGLRRGGVALSVRTDEAQYERALDILDADGAVDIDERAGSWRTEGWPGYPGDAARASTHDIAFAGADASTAGFGASFAGEDGYAPPEPTTRAGSADAESRADTSLVGTGAGEPGLLNPDMRERIGSGTASMTPPTPTGSQDSTLNDNAATRDRGSLAYANATAAEDAALGSPTRSGTEMPTSPSTIGSTAGADLSQARNEAPAWASRRDDTVQRARVKGYILNPPDPRQQR